MFETNYHSFWQSQVQGASGQRLEMLHRDLTGTKIMLKSLILPVLGSFDDLELEYEMPGVSGVKIYGDTFQRKLRIIFEEEHYTTHAEKITRDRFSFERARIRSVALLGYTYFPYSREELEKKPEFCQRNLYEFIGRIGNIDGTGLVRLPVYEREVLRFAIMCNKPFQSANVQEWLMLKKEACRNVLRELVLKELIRPVGGSENRYHAFMITEKAASLLHRQKWPS